MGLHFFCMGTARDIFAFTAFFFLVSGRLSLVLLSIGDAALDFNIENTLARADMGYPVTSVSK